MLRLASRTLRAAVSAKAVAPAAHGEMPSANAMIVIATKDQIPAVGYINKALPDDWSYSHISTPAGMRWSNRRT
jgi:hypothetical protein